MDKIDELKLRERIKQIEENLKKNMKNSNVLNNINTLGLDEIIIEE